MKKPLIALALLILQSSGGWAEEWRPGQSASLHALVGAKVMVRPGVSVEGATLLVRDGLVVGVGTNLEIPAGARRWDVSGKVIHAGFLDPFVSVSRFQGKAGPPKKSVLKDEDGADLRAAGGPVAAGEGESESPNPVSSANPRVRADYRLEEHLQLDSKQIQSFREAGFVGLNLVPDKGIWRGQSAFYSLKGDSARENLWKSQVSQVVGPATREWGEISEHSYPGSFMGNLALLRQTLLDSQHYLKVQSLNGQRYLGQQRPTYESSLPAIAKLLEGQTPVFFHSDDFLEGRALEQTLHNAGAKKLLWVLGGRSWRRLDWLTEATRDGCELSVPCAFPKAPAAKTAGEWLDVSSESLENWNATPAVPARLAQQQVAFSFTGSGVKKPQEIEKNTALAIQRGLPPERALAAWTTQPAQQLGVSDRLGTLDSGKAASFVVRSADPFSPGSQVEQVWVEGVPHRCFSKPSEEKPQVQVTSDNEPAPVADALPPGGDLLIRNATVWTQGPRGTMANCDVLVRAGKIAQVGPNLTAGEATVVEASGQHLIPGIIDAHSHTAILGDVNEGTLSTTAMVRIKDVIDPWDIGIRQQLAGGVTAANLMHGSANAIGGQVITCKWKWGCKPEDMVVAGAPEGIKFALGENPKQSNWGEKYTSRYPQTRLGVAEEIRQQFLRAKQYRQDLLDFQSGKRSIPVRRDLALEALVEILEGKRLIHCHSYRQDELLMLMQLAQEQGFKIATFQHVLEGYKVADEIAKSGAGASTFSDWWAYKLEVVDAIPYNGNLLHEKGVVTSFNSDSNELARRLWTEAPKAIRYGDAIQSDQQALAFVTLNPARQLGVGHRMGSIEVGKDADFSLWTASPMTPKAYCLATFIEGRKYYDAGEEKLRHQQQLQRRNYLINLVEKARDSK